MNPEKYVKSLDEGDTPISAESLRQDIYNHREEDGKLQDKIPETIVVSIF